MKINIALLAGVSALSLMLSGCSAGGAKSYSSIDDLVTGYESSGLICNWTQTDQVTDALESGTCNSESVLMLFNDSAEATTLAESLADTMRGFGMDPTILVGPNWVINDTEVESLQPVLGGKLITK